MAKQSGLGQKLIIGGWDLSGDIGALASVHGGPSYQDMTGIDKSAHEREGTVRNAGMKFTSFFNADAGQATTILSVMPTTDVINTYMAAQSIGSASACMVAKQNGYDPKRTINAALTIETEMESNGYGLEWGNLLTAGLRTDVAPTNGTAFDFTDVTTLFGWQAYLQITALAPGGTNITVALEDSANNIAFAPLASGAFTAATAPQTAQRLQGGATDAVRRYVRAVTTGTFGSATFCVTFIRNYSTVKF